MNSAPNRAFRHEVALRRLPNYASQMRFAVHVNLAMTARVREPRPQRRDARPKAS